MLSVITIERSAKGGRGSLSHPCSRGDRFPGPSPSPRLEKIQAMIGRRLDKYDRGHLNCPTTSEGHKVIGPRGGVATG